VSCLCILTDIILMRKKGRELREKLGNKDEELRLAQRKLCISFLMRLLEIGTHRTKYSNIVHFFGTVLCVIS